MKIKTVAGVFCIIGFLATPLAFSGQQGAVWVTLKNKKTFSDYHITEIVVRPSCEKRTFFNEEQNIPIVESKTEGKISDMKKIGMPMKCRNNSGDEGYNRYYDELKPVALELQLTYKGKLITCKKQTLEDPTIWAHSATIKSISGDDNTCDWFIK